MTRQTRLNLMAATFACAVAIPCAASAQDRPNILLVVADDLGFSDTGPYGGEISTPTIDALAEQGTLFTDFHASVSCSPTRSMLMSGNDNHVAGLGQMAEILAPNQVGQPGYEGHLNDRVASMAEVLRDAGYKTYMAGKWHLGHEKGSLPHDRGFDETLTLLVGGASHWNDRLGINPGDDPAEYAMNGEFLEELPADFFSSRSYTDHLMDLIRSGRDDDRPFFGYLAFTAPHDPVHAPEPWHSMYRGVYDEGYEVLERQRWESARTLGILPEDADLAPMAPIVERWDELSDDRKAAEARAMEIYAGMVTNMDYHLGRMLDFLTDIGEIDNTLIIFLSDNGANPWFSSDYPGATEPEFADQFDNSLGNIGHPGSNVAYGSGWAGASSGPLDRFKMTVGEGGMRVPLIIAGPGISSGERTDAFAYVWDILPTVMELTGATYPADKEQPRGRSMMPLLTGDTDALYGEDELVGGEMGEGKWMRQGAFKAVTIPAPYGDGNWRLFNVETDPGEANDLSAEMPDLLSELRAAYDAYAEEVGVIPAEQ